MKIILVVSFLANVLLIVLVGLHQREDMAQVRPNAAVVSPADSPEIENAIGFESDPAPEVFKWSRLQHADLKIYRQNLEAVGCPALTIRDIIIAEIDERFRERRQVLLASLQSKIWDAALQGEPGVRAKLCRPLDELGGERQRMIEDVLGGTQRVSAGPVGPEGEPSGEEPWSGSRESMWAAGLSGFQPTQEEWVVVTRLRMAFEEEQAELNNSAELSDEDRQQRQQQLQSALNTNIRSALGEDRFAEYELAHEAGFQELHRITERYGIPLETARRAHQIQTELQIELERLRQGDAFGGASEQSVLDSLRQEAERALAEVIGSRALATYKEYSSGPLSLNNAAMGETTQ